MKEPIYLIALAVFFIWVGAVAHSAMTENDKSCQITFSDGRHNKHVYVGVVTGDSNE